MIITAKFASTCPSCSRPIVAGTKVEWERGQKAKHVSCDAADATPEAPASEPPQSTPTTTTRHITVERVGRRSYLRGETYAVRGMLRAAGCHWDGDQTAWWIGSHDEAIDLAERAKTAPAETAPSPRRAPSRNRGRWNGCSCVAPGRCPTAA